MRTIQAQKLCREKFLAYGTFYDFLNPAGIDLGDFYPDRIQIPVSGINPFGLSPLTVRKPERYIVSAAEYHDYSGEILLPIDGDVVIHVAPASAEPVPARTEAFIVPAGTVVHLLTGVWHLCPYAIDKNIVNCLIGLPIRTYKNDCVVVQYAIEDQIEIQL